MFILFIASSTFFFSSFLLPLEIFPSFMDPSSVFFNSIRSDRLISPKFFSISALRSDLNEEGSPFRNRPNVLISMNSNDFSTSIPINLSNDIPPKRHSKAFPPILVIPQIPNADIISLISRFESPLRESLKPCKKVLSGFFKVSRLASRYS